MDPQTPVLVGAANAGGRVADPGAAPEAVSLMASAAREAAARTGRPDVLAEVDRIVVPRGSWGYRDPGRLVAGELGCTAARTVLADLGVLQSALLNGAVADLAAGRTRVVLVAGGEARHRLVAAGRADVPAAETPQADDVVPDEVVSPAHQVIHPLEVQRRLVQAVEHYALLENATRHHDGMTVAEHRRAIAELWAACNRTAAGNPDAWNPAPMDATAIAEPAPGNRPLAFPYNKWHVTQWNVDQAAALLLTTVGTARALGLDESGWVFPLAGADSDHMVPVVARAEPWRCPGAGIAGRAALAAAGVAAADLEVVDLYSCFPIAVRLQAVELGLDDGRDLTVGGGMAFAGGPFNNAVLQATVRAAHLLAGHPGASGLVTAVSGMLTKQGMTVWSATPPTGGFVHEDVTAATAAATPERPVDGEAQGTGTLASYTVRYDEAGPSEVVALVDLDDGPRTLGFVRDRGVADAMTRDEGCGTPVRVAAGGEVAVL